MKQSALAAYGALGLPLAWLTHSIAMVPTLIVAGIALGVFVGVLLSGVFFAFKVMRLLQVEERYDEASRTRTYTVRGQVFFASAEMFADAFDLRDAMARLEAALDPKEPA